MLLTIGDFFYRCFCILEKLVRIENEASRK